MASLRPGVEADGIIDDRDRRSVVVATCTRPSALRPAARRWRTPDAAHDHARLVGAVVPSVVHTLHDRRVALLEQRLVRVGDEVDLALRDGERVQRFDAVNAGMTRQIHDVGEVAASEIDAARRRSARDQG